jgi:erythromycin esterase
MMRSAWILTVFASAFCMASLPGAAQPTDRVDPIVDWLRSRATPIAHVEPRADLSDLQFLKPVLGGARMVGLGEATHGTREIFQFKHRLVQFLVTELSFTTLAMEASTSEIEPLNEYVLQGTGDVNEALTAQGYIGWDTEEIAAMMEWIRAHNSRAADERRVQVVGLDILLHSRGRARVLNYLRAHAASRVTETEAVFEILAEEEENIASPSLRPDRVAASLRSLEGLRDFLLAQQKSGRADSAGHLELALRDVQRMVQRALSARARDVAGRLDRSEAMGHNALELIGNPTASKVIVWAHNVHVAAQYADGRANLGSVLRGALGDAYYALGFEFESGRVQVRTSTAQGAGGPLGEIEVAPAPAQSLPWYLAQSNAADLFVDFRGPRPPVVEGWLSQAVEAHFIWWAHKPDQARTVREPAGRYDGLVFIRTSSPARPTKNAIERAASGKGL